MALSPFLFPAIHQSTAQFLTWNTSPETISQQVNVIRHLIDKKQEYRRRMNSSLGI